MKRMADVEIFLHLVNNQNDYRGLMQRFATETFISLECWPTLQRNLSGYLIVWLHTRPLRNAPMLIRPDLSFQLTFGKLHYLYSSTLALGYLIELPKIRTEIADTYAMCSSNKRRVAIGKVDDLESLNHIFNDSHLAVFTMGNSQLMASTDKRLVDFLK
jgi:hypothetical protein